MLRVESKKQTFPLFAILVNNNFNGHVQKPGTPEHLGTAVHFDYMVCNRKTKQHRQI